MIRRCGAIICCRACEAICSKNLGECMKPVRSSNGLRLSRETCGRGTCYWSGLGVAVGDGLLLLSPGDRKTQRQRAQSSQRKENPGVLQRPALHFARINVMS